MRHPLITDQYYHVYNRGVDKRDIFNDKKDLNRFIESLQEFNRIKTITSLANLRKSNQIALQALSEKKPLVAFVVFCINPNHFHFVLKQLVDGGIAKFMQKLQAGYTSYFNIRNSRSGSLLQGAFKSQIMVNENYFNKILGYVNKNYQVHHIPQNKSHLVYASDYEYENNKFQIISTEEASKILEIFEGGKNFKKHCDEIIDIIRKERGKLSLLEDEKVPDSA